MHTCPHWSLWIADFRPEACTIVAGGRATAEPSGAPGTRAVITGFALEGYSNRVALRPQRGLALPGRAKFKGRVLPGASSDLPPATMGQAFGLKRVIRGSPTFNRTPSAYPGDLIVEPSTLKGVKSGDVFRVVATSLSIKAAE